MFIYSKSPYDKLYNSDEKKIDAFIQSFSENYHKISTVSLHDDMVDLSLIGPPVLKSVEPATGPEEGGIRVSLIGKLFDHRLGGCYAKFGKAIVPHKGEITPNKVSFVLPPVSEAGGVGDTIVEVDLAPTGLSVNVSNKTKIIITASNDNKNYSNTNVEFVYIGKYCL